MFNNYDVLVLETLEASGGDFKRLVADQLALGVKLDSAVMEVFLVECFSSFFGIKWSPAAKHLNRFQKWMKDRGFTTLSKEEIRTKHRENVDQWANGPSFNGRGSDRAWTVATLSQVCLRYIYDCCYTGRDRQLALLLTTDLCERLWPRSATEIMSSLTPYYYDPSFTENQLWKRIDLIRRRLAAYMAIEGVAAKLPKIHPRFKDEEKVLAWLLCVAGVANLEQAKKLLSTSIIGQESPPEHEENYAQAVSDLDGMFKKLGIKTEIEGTKTSPTLYVWYDIETQTPTDNYPSLQINPPGIYYKNRQPRPIKELL